MRSQTEAGWAAERSTARWKKHWRAERPFCSCARRIWMRSTFSRKQDGIHVGQSDMEAGDVRKLLGPDKILGVSAQTVEQALLAEQRGADYLGVGAVFPTGSKDDADDVSYETLKAICSAVSIPVVAIGGISQNNVMQLKGSGICGIAVISAIFAQKDIKAATQKLKESAKECVSCSGK